MDRGMMSWPVRIRPALIPLGLLIASTGVQLAGVEWVQLFRFQRTAIMDGECWRLVTAHIVHGTWRHWLLNMGGLVLIWAIYPRQFAQISTLPLSLGITLLTSAALLIWSPEIMWYVGMSALLHGLFVAWAMADLFRGRRIAIVAILLVGAKLVYEQLAGPLPGSEVSAGLPVVVDSHLYAALAGGFLGAVLTLIGWLRVDLPAEKRRSL